MTIHQRGLIVTAAFGLVLWLAADLRWAAVVPLATLLWDWPQVAGAFLARRR